MALGTLEIGVAANTRRAERKLENLEDQAEDTASAGESISTKMAGLKAVAAGGAAAGAAAMAAMAAGAVKAAGAVGNLLQRTGNYAETIERAADRTGLTVEETEGLAHAMEEVGQDIDRVPDALDTMNERMLEVKEGAGEGKEAFEALGVSVTDAEGNFRDTGDVFGDTLQGLRDIESQSEQSAQAQKLFGDAGAELMPIIQDTSLSLDEMVERAREAGVTMGEDGIRAAADFNDSLRSLRQTVTGLGRDFAADLIPSAELVVETAEHLLDGFSDFEGGVGDLSEIMRDFTEQALLATLDAGVAFLDWIGETLDAVAEFADGVSMAITVVSGIIDALMTWAKIQRTIAMVIGNLITGALSDMAGGLQDIIDNVALLAEVLGEDEMASGLRRAADAAGDTSDALGDFEDFLDEEAASNIAEIGQTIEGGFGVDIGAEEIEAGADRLKRVADELGLTIEETRDALASGEIAVGEDETETDTDEEPESEATGDPAAAVAAATSAAGGAAGAAADEASEAASMRETELNLLRVRNEMLGAGSAIEEQQLVKIEARLEFERRLQEIKAEGHSAEREALLIDQARLEMTNKQAAAEDEIGRIKEEANREAENSIKSTVSTIQSGVGEAQKFAGAIAEAADASDETQSNLQTGIGLLGSGAGLAGGIASGNPMMAVGGGVGLVTGLVELFGDEEEDDNNEDMNRVQGREDQREFADLLAKRIVDEQEARLGRAVEVSVDARGALIGDENEVQRQMADMVEDELNQRVGGDL